MYQIHTLLFFFFSSLVIGSSILVIRSKNPIHSVIFLIFTFFNATILLLLFKIEFLSFMLIIIYVGAIAILFLFVVMMLDIKIINNNLKFDYIVIGFIIGSIFFLEIIYVLNDIFLFTNIKHINTQYWVYLLDNITNVETFGQVLYSYYNFFFITAGLILIIALLGAVSLTFKPKQNEQKIYKQLSRNAYNSFFTITSLNIKK